MEEKKNLCAPIPLSLHQRLRAEQEQRGQTLADYITDILREHFEGGARTMNANNRPENLTARPMLWLWTLRDVAWIGTGLLLSVLALTQTGSMIPLVITAALAFLCIRHGGISMLDFLRYAAAFFFFGQQYYVWRESA